MVKPIKIVDGTSVQLKSEITKSVDIHLQDVSQYVNVILPNNTILVVEPNSVVTYYEDDNLIEEHIFKPLKDYNEMDNTSNNFDYFKCQRPI